MDNFTEESPQSNIVGPLHKFFRTRYKFSASVTARIVKDVLQLIRLHNPDFLKEGQVVRYVVAKTEPMGKPLQNCQFLPVRLTLYAPEDAEYRKRNGLKKLKHFVIQRITQEAIAHGGVLSQENIANILFLDRRTVTEYIKELESRNVQIITRARLSVL